MELLFRVWRFVILLVLGSVFLAELTVIFAPHLSSTRGIAAATVAVVRTWRPSDAFFLIPIAAVVLAVAGALGVFLLDVIAEGFSTAISLLVRAVPTGAGLEKSPFLANLLLPATELAHRYYAAHRETLLDYGDIMNRALSEFKITEAKIKGLQSRISVQLDRPDVLALYEPVNFHHLVTQDQFRIERMKDEISSIALLWILIPLALVAELRLGLRSTVMFDTSVAALIALGSSLPALAEKRRKYAALILVGYITAFQYGRGADVADRPM